MQIKILVILAKKRSSKKIHNLETIKEREKRVDLTTQKFQTINTENICKILQKGLVFLIYNSQNRVRQII